MLNPKVRIILMILGPLFMLTALSNILPSTASTFLFAFGVAQIFLLLFKGGG